MVEPLDAQNMLSRTPMVERTAAVHKDSAVQQNIQAEHARKESLHHGEEVTSQGETHRTEDKPPKDRSEAGQQGKKGQASEQNHVEWVDEAADEPVHKIDITI